MSPSATSLVVSGSSTMAAHGHFCFICVFAHTCVKMWWSALFLLNLFLLRWKQATGGHWGLSLHQCCINDTYWDTNVFILFSGHACFQYCGSYFVTWLLTDLAFRLLTCGADSILWQAWGSAWELFNGLPRRQNLYTWTCLLEGHQVATKGNFSVSTVMPTGSCRKYSFSGKICETVLWPKTRQTCDVGRSAYSQTTWEAYFFSLATRFL